METGRPRASDSGFPAGEILIETIAGVVTTWKRLGTRSTSDEDPGDGTRNRFVDPVSGIPGPRSRLYAMHRKSLVIYVHWFPRS